MKILWIVTLTGGDENRASDLHEFLKKIFFPNGIVMRRMSRGTESIESRPDEAYAAIPIIDKVRRAERPRIKRGSFDEIAGKEWSL